MVAIFPSGAPGQAEHRDDMLAFLSGAYLGLWECHVEPDWLLVYDVSEELVELAATGTHADLFG